MQTFKEQFSILAGFKVALYLLVVCFFIWFIRKFSTMQVCNANEGWPFSKVRREGHSDWLVKFGWFIMDKEQIDLSYDNDESKGIASCQAGKMQWLRLGPAEMASITRCIQEVKKE